MSRVFVVHQPTGRDLRTGAIRPTMDLSPAREYGELRFVLREWENPFADIDSTVAEVRRVLEGERFGTDDWLLLVGNPVLIAVVASVAVELAEGQLRMLQWNRAQHAYQSVIAQVDPLDGDDSEG